MKGFRSVGERKQRLLKKIQELLNLHAKYGINSAAIIVKRYKLKSPKQIINIPTKKLSGVISDLKELI